jgi:hypothetical protein
VVVRLKTQLPSTASGNTIATCAKYKNKLSAGQYLSINQLPNAKGSIATAGFIHTVAQKCKNGIPITF